jgi:putative flippase GtrA
VPSRGGPARAAFAVRRFYQTSRVVLHEVAKFGVVGCFNYALDVGIFNALVVGPLEHQPLTAKTISTAVAATSSYFMNRHWTFRHRAYSGLAREYALFAVLTGAGLGINIGCLAFSEYVLDARSLLARNIAGNVVGVALAMIFRFWSYKRWVFVERRDGSPSVAETTARTTF